MRLSGILGVPQSAQGVVAFAHGSGSGRFSPRNQFVAKMLERAGLATLLLDLLTEQESIVRSKVFDIDLLADRLVVAAEWLAEQPNTKSLPLGFFGASTGAAAALVAAARNPIRTKAVVSRGGRPDLAVQWLSLVQAPTLLIVGGNDEFVIDLNQQAQRQMVCTNEILIVPGATHLFEEPGTLEQVTEAARGWFLRFLSSGARDRDWVA